jgi:Mycothiol maleylpyruvate isomerase N-terminal domain
VIEAWEPSRVQDAFAEGARRFALLVRDIPAGAWYGPGLGEWNLRDLVGHTSRSLITVETYLGQPAEREEVRSPEGYYAAIAQFDQTGVADRGRAAGQALGDDPLGTIGALVDRVLPLLDRDDDPVITTAAGGMRLSNYLPTRTFELVVHGTDIARAAGLAPPDYSQATWVQVATLAAAASVLQGRGVELVRALTGRDPLDPRFSMV